MRLGTALDLHATRACTAEVAWPRLRDQARAAEEVGLDLLVLPDHLYYAPGGDNEYALPDEPLGVWESVSIAAGLAEATTRIGIGHSMINTPYRSPAMVANIAATLDAISDGRYSLGVGSGNSYDYAELGIDATDRHQRFAEALEVIAGMLRGDTVQLAGQHVSAAGAALVLAPARPDGPPLVVAANGPRSRRLAARFGDGWNVWVPTDAEQEGLAGAIAHMADACTEVGRDRPAPWLTVDLAVDPLDLAGKRALSQQSLARLAELGVTEARCYPMTEPTHASRSAAIEALPAIAPR